MRKSLLTLFTAIVISLSALADEGMWLPHLIGQQLYADMVKKGLKLTKDQLYNLNKASLKDAIVLLDNNYTGTVIGSEGLIITSYEPAYRILSNPSENFSQYISDGFYANAKSNEIVSPSLTARFLLRIEDVTTEVQTALGTSSGLDRSTKQNEIFAAINKRLSDNTQNIEASTGVYFSGNQFLSFVYQKFNTVKLVAAPAASVALFGRNNDNWEWPRQAGSFSIFRVYNGANTPVVSKYVVPVSLKGYKDAEAVMAWGYPRSTNRYASSFEIKRLVETENPARVALLDVRLKALQSAMQKDTVSKKILSFAYDSLSAVHKRYDAETRIMVKQGLQEQKKVLEEKFQAWSKSNPGFDNALPSLARLYSVWIPFEKHRIYIEEGILGSPLLAFAASLQEVENAIVKQGRSADIKKAVDAATKAREIFLKSEQKEADLEIVSIVLRMFYDNIDKNQHPIGFYESMRGSFGSLREEPTFKRYAVQIFSTTMILDDNKWNAFVKLPAGKTLQEDMAFAVSTAFIKNYVSKYSIQHRNFQLAVQDANRQTMQGTLLMDTVKAKKMYPDANHSLRISPGNIRGYKRGDAVTYNSVATMKGLMDKYKPGDDAFNLPAKLTAVAGKKDFAGYLDKTKNDLLVCFIANVDMSEDNSGAAILNNNGELLGIAIGGNAEATSYKTYFDKDSHRTVCVDTRYILWHLDKVAGAANVVKEIKIVR